MTTPTPPSSFSLPLRLISDARIVCLSLTTLSAFALGAALTAQYAFGMAPCTLCLYQRAPYIVIAILGIVGFVLASYGRPKAAALLVFISGLFFIAGTAVAAYHHGVEQKWWVSALEGCKLTFSADGTQSLLDRIQSLSAVPCDLIPWQDPVFGWSMAAWNMIISPLLALLSIVASILIARRANNMLPF